MHFHAEKIIVQFSYLASFADLTRMHWNSHFFRRRCTFAIYQHGNDIFLSPCVRFYILYFIFPLSKSSLGEKKADDTSCRLFSSQRIYTHVRTRNRQQTFIRRDCLLSRSRDKKINDLLYRASDKLRIILDDALTEF